MTRALEIFAAFGALLVLAGMGCSSPTDLQPGGVKAVVISLDGLRPDALTDANAPTIRLIAKGGAATVKAQTVLPTLTLPSHTSMMTGLIPDRHGITWNDDTTGHNERVPFPTMFDIARDHGFTTAMFVGKSKLLPIVHSGSPTMVDMPGVGEIWVSDSVALHVTKYLATLTGQRKPDLMFIHLPDIDVAGHAFGWMSPQYIAAVKHSDSLVANIWTALKASMGSNLVLIITADHGGSGTGHYDGSPLSRTTPWIAWGKGVSAQLLTVDVRTVDVAPTMLWAIGIDPPADWDGVPVKAAFPKLVR